MKHTCIWTITLVMLIATVGIATATDPKDMGGWEIDGKYNRLYAADELDSFKGRVVSVKKITPLPGMSPGIAVIVEDRGGEDVLVHIGPQWFVKRNDLGLRKGDKVKVKGVWADIDEQEIFMASKIKRSEFSEYKIRRTSDGKPFWAMTPQELAKERQE
jgi:hypothetical protein